MDKSIISNLMVDFFKAVLKSDNKSAEYINNLNEEALKCGYIINPDACGLDNDWLFKYLGSKSINVNSTFYKTWEDVTSKNRLELFIDQCLHYLSTYGTEFTGETYIDNDDTKIDDKIVWDSYIYIDAWTPKKYFEECVRVLESGMALNSTLVDDVCNYIATYATVIEKISQSDLEVLVLNLKNKEAKRKLMVSFRIKPKTGQELFEFLYTYITKETLIIKNHRSKDIINVKVRELLNINDPILNSIDDNDMRLLASVFYRYKPLFLSMKHGIMISKINKIRKYADKYHEPLKQKYLDNIIQNAINDKPDVILTNIVKQSKNVTTFKLISILNSLYMNLSIASSGDNYKLYRIRNGKSFTKECKIVNFEPNDSTKINLAINAIYSIIVERLKSKAGVIALPDGIEMVCPTSEKNFVGDIPMNSYINMNDKNNVIGIYWRNEWGTRDYDLSALTDNGCRIGWCGDFYDKNKSIIYSGDMTNADPEATELLYSSGKMKESDTKGFNIYVNRYNGRSGTKFNLFYGCSEIEHMCKNHMISSEDIKFRADFSPEQNGFMVGRVIDNVLYFTNFSNGNSIISGRSIDIEKDTIAINNLVKSSLNLKSLLLDAGFKLYDKNIHDKIDYDLSMPDKNILLSIFS